MLKGIAAAASGMLPQVKKQEAIANNLANAGTAGFKRDRIFVQDLTRAQAQAVQKSLPDWQLPQMIGVTIDFTAGALDRTDNPYDVAVAGEGLFAIQTPNGEQYTRNGHFQVSPEGVLITADGHAVLGEGGEIQLPAGTLTIGSDRTASVDGKIVDKLKIVRFSDPRVLTRAASSLFKIGVPGVSAEEDSTSMVRQGFLESSNVNTVEEMVNMITTFRFYEADQKVLKAQDQTLGRVVNELGRVPR